MNAANGVDPFSPTWFETGLHAGNRPDDLGGAGLEMSSWIVQLDSSTVLDYTAVDALMAEWTRTTVDYAARISNLRNGGGANGTYKLINSAVPSESAVDTLLGGGDLDWFWGYAGDLLPDRGVGGVETLN